ncbi:Putative 3-methyladenine DNA glycosylase [Sporomusa rhizae]|uniref:DNA-3-methyladenine glycosylase n=1 Tax=Sporomusa rhizae TaxID=357999 RepID=UPI00352AE9F2
MKIVDREFYNRDSLIVAQELLGKVLVHEINGQKLAVKIVEAEAYMGVTDKASPANTVGLKRIKERGAGDGAKTRKHGDRDRASGFIL